MSGLGTSDLLFFVDDVVLFASLDFDLQRALERFAVSVKRSR